MMLNDKTRAELDQGIAMAKETLPQLWRSLYLGCVEAGFTGGRVDEDCFGLH
jgi:hypothetical protein